MRALCVSVVMMAACAPPEVPVPPLVNTPVLTVPVSSTPFPTFTLTGTADDDTIIRLYVDERCAGAVLRELSVETLRGGLELELVPRASNVFTARAYSKTGQRSECSDGVRVESTPLEPPRQPTLQVEALGPRPTGQFRLFGSVDPQPTVLVRLFEGQCAGTPLQVMTPAEFARGARVKLPANTFSYFFAQSIDATSARSQCSSIFVSTDDRPPPSATLRVTSPNPVSGLFATVAVSGVDVVRVRAYELPRCRGPSSTCDNAFSECLMTIPLNAPVVEWSARVEDGQGNGVCIDGPEVLIRDDRSYFEQAPVLELSRPNVFSQWVMGARVQTWSRYTFVQFFRAADCEGDVERSSSPWDAMRLAAVDRGTVWSARMGVVTPFGSEFGKCSDTVQVPTE